jgi:hypothetical protein
MLQSESQNRFSSLSAGEADRSLSQLAVLTETLFDYLQPFLARSNHLDKSEIFKLLHGPMEAISNFVLLSDQSYYGQSKISGIIACSCLTTIRQPANRIWQITSKALLSDLNINPLLSENTDLNEEFDQIRKTLKSWLPIFLMLDGQDQDFTGSVDSESWSTIFSAIAGSSGTISLDNAVSSFDLAKTALY